MKRDARKILVLCLFSIMLVSFVAGVVSAQTSDDTRWNKIKEEAKTTFSKVFGTTLTGEPIWEMAVTKFLLMLLVFTIVFGVSDILIMDTTRAKIALKIIFSIVISYLSVIYLAPGEITSALVGWGAMAVTITAIIPIAVILALSWRLASNPNPAKMFIQKIMLVVFTVYLGYRVAALIWFKPPEVWSFALAVYIPAFILILIILIFNKLIQRFILTTQISGYLQISDALNKEEALAEVIMLRDKANALDKIGASAEAARLRTSATNLEVAAKSKFK